MKIIYKPVGGEPFEMDIDKSLESFQSLVDGYFEYVMVFQDTAVVCNEEGRIRQMPYNCTVFGMGFYGPIFFVGVGRTDWKDCNLTVDQVKNLYQEVHKDDDDTVRDE